MLPFLIETRVFPVRLFELDDGRFQLLETMEVGPFLPGYGYLLVERALGDFLIEHDVERIVLEEAVLFERSTGNEYRTHVRIRVRQYFTPEQIRDLDLTA